MDFGIPETLENLFWTQAGRIIGTSAFTYLVGSVILFTLLVMIFDMLRQSLARVGLGQRSGLGLRRDAELVENAGLSGADVSLRVGWLGSPHRSRVASDSADDDALDNSRQGEFHERYTKK